jgi:hypothetical protein
MQNINQNNINKIQKLTKYILMGLIVLVATKYIPDNQLKTKEIIMIGATSSISFAILDMISPSIKINREIKNEQPSKILVEGFMNN